MPSNEWAGKDKPAYDRNPFRNQHSPSPRPAGASASRMAAPSSEAKPGNGKGIKTAFENASETVRPYLPGSVAAYLRTYRPCPSAGAAAKQSPLPSKEIPGGSKVGVGSLPGNLSEASVAKLPEERAMEARARQQQAKKTKHAGPAAASPTMYQNAKGYLPESVAAYLPGGAAPDSPLPSKEKPSGSAGGVGSLPGNYSEVSVAKTPEERRLEGMPSHETDHEVLGKTRGVGALPGGPNESRVAMLPEERVHPQYDSGVTGSKSLAVGGGAVGAGAGVAAARGMMGQRETRGSGIGPSGLDPGGGAHHSTSTSGGAAAAAHSDVRNAEMHTLGERKAQQQQQQGTEGTSAERRSTSGSEGSAGSERQKVGFLKKMKGEAKVISGKLGHNEKKVEEGKHMMGK
ncbi:hypothetical protein H0H87_008329 [Tephrocybe sp. NHM501043]|nr:hypothetical protein H0H87_008329 [Tephrocybe sp. NHM501043]